MKAQFKGLVVVFAGTLLAAACTVTSENKKGTDGGSGGSATGGGGATGTGGGGTGGSTGGANTGGTTTDAATDSSTGGADAATTDATTTDARGNNDAAACQLDGAANQCEVCMTSKCCAAWTACTGACVTEIGDFQTCMMSEAAKDGGTASINTCRTAVMAMHDGAALATGTNALIACMTSDTGDAGPSNCASVCIGGTVIP